MLRDFPSLLAGTFLLFLIHGKSNGDNNEAYLYPCDSTIFCWDDLLDTLQRAHIRPSKDIVDMSITEDPDVVWEAFKRGGGSSMTKGEVGRFLKRYFVGPGHELTEWTPSDWTENPSLLKRIKNPRFRQWAKSLNNLWKRLGRKVKDEVYMYPQRHSMIWVPHPFIVAGVERFREFYYWDSFWIIKALLLCDMTVTARSMIHNILYLVTQYGHMPNGNRIYYTRRSQPPMLIPMAQAYINATNDIDFLSGNINKLELEYTFWLKHRSVNVVKDRRNHTLLLRYAVQVGYPRPEGYHEDLMVTRGLNASATSETYSHIASACESGWDFSSRWFSWEGPYKETLRTARTKHILPVDLNTFVLWAELILADFWEMLGDTGNQRKYKDRAARRAKSIQAVFWNEDQGVWFDYDIVKQEHRQRFYPSNIFPLYIIGKYNLFRRNQTARVLEYLKRERVLTYPGGIPTSKVESGQQWDFPDAWPPLVSIFIQALADSGSTEAKQVALQVANTWLISNLAAFDRYGDMFEKYDIRTFGTPGGGGEYTVQTGFGWTNGVILELLNKYANDLPLSSFSTVSRMDWPISWAPGGIVIVIVFFFLVIVCPRRIAALRGTAIRHTALKAGLPLQV